MKYFVILTKSHIVAQLLAKALGTTINELLGE